MILERELQLHSETMPIELGQKLLARAHSLFQVLKKYVTPLLDG